MPAVAVRRRLDVERTPTEVLRALRGRPGLVGLVGCWAGVRAIIGWEPARRLAPDGDPFATLGDLTAVTGDAKIAGGWFGVLGYQLGARLERLPDPPARPTPRPDAVLARYDRVLVLDDDGWWLESVQPADATGSADDTAAAIAALLAAPPDVGRAFICGPFGSTPDSGGHEAAVQKTLDHLVAGDIFQANVCRRLEASFEGDPLDVFCVAVETLAPRYAGFVQTDDGAVASLSPELFLRRQGRHVRTSPIKGTAPLDTDVQRLVRSAKDRAEHVMIVDLMRNDLGRVCEPGTVRVEHAGRAERHTGVWHLVSDVVGRLRPDAGDSALLRATFPPGSVTGAPKIRAMEIINDVEATAREAYTGAVGYASPVAGLELNVAIRTFEFAAGRVWLGVGGGVVLDSTPTGELAETLVKARPLLDAIGAELADPRGRASVAPADQPGGRQEGPPSLLAAPPVDRTRGVFTTILVRDGVPVDLDAHVTRLTVSARRLDLETAGRLREQITAHASGLLGRHRLRVTCTAVRDGAADIRVETSDLIGRSSAPLDLVPLVVPGGLGQEKWVDRRRLQPPHLAAWSDTTDALVLDSFGEVLETGRGSLFVVTDDAVLTPALDGRLLPGVTRARAIASLTATGIPVREQQIALADLHAATEVFVTGSLDRIRPVASVDGVGSWAVGPMTRWAARTIDAAGPAAAHRPAVAHATSSVLVIDNYDSFVYNLDQYLLTLGCRTRVARNDAISVDEVRSLVAAGEVDRIVISPGPGRPEQAGICVELIRRLDGAVPVLGVCLGSQCIAAAYGAGVVPADEARHGRQSIVYHDGSGVFSGLTAPVVAGRYHSLVVSESSLPSDLRPTAHTGSGVLMGIRHRTHPVRGRAVPPRVRADARRNRSAAPVSAILTRHSVEGVHQVVVATPSQRNRLDVATGPGEVPDQRDDRHAWRPR